MVTSCGTHQYVHTEQGEGVPGWLAGVFFWALLRGCWHPSKPVLRCFPHLAGCELHGLAVLQHACTDLRALQGKARGPSGVYHAVRPPTRTCAHAAARLRPVLAGALLTFVSSIVAHMMRVFCIAWRRLFKVSCTRQGTAAGVENARPQAAAPSQCLPACPAFCLT